VPLAAAVSGRSSRWSAAPAIRVSIGLHALAAAGVMAAPPVWPWALGGVLANHLALGCIGMCPRSRLLGPNMIRLPAAAIHRGEVALTFDDGPDPKVTPAVLDLLDRHRVQASFFCIGERAAAHPDLVREMARRGHSIENHSHTHPNGFACYPPAWLARELLGAQEAIAGVSGRAPAFFRPPMGLRSPMLAPVLSRLRLQHVSWTRRGCDTLSADPTAVLRRLTRGLAAGDVLLLHDGHCARTGGGRAVTLEVLPSLLDRIAATGLRAVSLPAALC
jgi:peptidoglycan-N-acetylglucosamine deacetylase